MPIRPEVRWAALRAAGALASVACSSAPSGSGPGGSTSSPPPPAANCQVTLDSALPPDDPYPATPGTYSPAVHACCRALTDGARHDIEGSRHRFACCAMEKPSTKDSRIACTPWGPPVPPPFLRA